MGLWKYRSEDQIAEDQSLRLFLRVDMELEPVELSEAIDADGNVSTPDPEKVVSGNVVWVQLKSIRGTKAGNLKPYDVETSLLRHVMGCSIPVCLVVVDLTNSSIYWVHLQGWLRSQFQNGRFQAWTNTATARVAVQSLPFQNEHSSGVFKTWLNISLEPALIKELAVLQGHLYRAWAATRQLRACSRQPDRTIYKQLSDHLSAAWCKAILFHPEFKLGWKIHNQILDPLIDRVDLAVQQGSLDLDKVEADLSSISDFAADMVEQLSAWA